MEKLEAWYPGDDCVDLVGADLYVAKGTTQSAVFKRVNDSVKGRKMVALSEFGNLLDIDEYANYMAMEFYLGGTDWPQNNVKGFRHRDNGRFRFVVYDLDGTFATSNPFNDFMGKETYTFDQLYPTSLGRIRDKIRFVTLFKNLLKNADFCRRFVDAYCIMGGSVSVNVITRCVQSVSLVKPMRSRYSP